MNSDFSCISHILSKAPVVPVIVMDNLEKAIPLARALVAGGLPVLEVTLRTPIAFEAIRLMKTVPGAIVGAGTVTNCADLKGALNVGSDFVVSPGLVEKVAITAAQRGVPFLPGVSTASDIMRGRALGLTYFKFFPAAASGGLSALKALSAPFAECRFCPTGGIDAGNAAEWLKFDPVMCVGGTWVAPRGASDMLLVERAAREATKLRLQGR